MGQMVGDLPPPPLPGSLQETTIKRRLAMATQSEKKKAKITKALSVLGALLFPAYMLHLIINENFLLQAITVAITGVVCYVSVNLLRGKSFDEIKEDAKEDIEDLKD